MGPAQVGKWFASPSMRVYLLRRGEPSAPRSLTKSPHLNPGLPAVTAALCPSSSELCMPRGELPSSCCLPACQRHTRNQAQGQAQSSRGGTARLSSRAPWLGVGSRGESNQHSFTLAGAVTSPNYFPAPRFISDPGIYSDCRIYPHLSQIHH